MKIWPEKYSYQVCPFCNSKKIRPVAVVHFYTEDGDRKDVAFIDQSGYLCEHCKRYHLNGDTKDTIDRKEMRRDINQLLKFLGKEIR